MKPITVKEACTCIKKLVRFCDAWGFAGTSWRLKATARLLRAQDRRIRELERENHQLKTDNANIIDRAHDMAWELKKEKAAKPQKETTK